MTSFKVNEEFFLVWESSCRNFIDGICFGSENAKRRFKVHVFLRKDTPSDAIPPSEQENEWIKHHASLTTSPYASETALVSFVTKVFSGPFSDRITWPNRIYLVSDGERQHDELIAVLTTSRRFRGGLDVNQVDGSGQGLMDVIDDVCKFCKLVFLDEEELREHNVKKHNYFCDNLMCSHGRFYTEGALLGHKANQTSCPYCCGKVFCTETERNEHFQRVHKGQHPDHQTAGTRKVRKVQSEPGMKFLCPFCPAKSFSSSKQHEVHMKHSHKKCNCSCGQYFPTREEYLEHFYSVYPLGCFENRKCPQRFWSVTHQAKHHEESHNSTHPFYCVPCYLRKLEEGGTWKVRFKDEKSLQIHREALGHVQEEMFLSAHSDALKLDAPDQRRAPSRTCSAINFCWVHCAGLGCHNKMGKNEIHLRKVGEGVSCMPQWFIKDFLFQCAWFHKPVPKHCVPWMKHCLGWCWWCGVVMILMRVMMRMIMVVMITY